jgi:hypothetical protein
MKWRISHFSDKTHTHPHTYAYMLEGNTANGGDTAKLFFVSLWDKRDDRWCALNVGRTVACILFIETN